MIYFWKMKICIKFFLIRCFPDKNNGPDSKEGSRCAAQKNQKYCKSVQGDCRHISGACPPERWALPCLSLVHTAVLNWPIRDKNMWCHQLLLGSFRCEFQSKINKYMKYYECECADGYTGDYSAVVTTICLYLVKISISQYQATDSSALTRTAPWPSPATPTWSWRWRSSQRWSEMMIFR